jgi:hypothetical protein
MIKNLLSVLAFAFTAYLAIPSPALESFQIEPLLESVLDQQELSRDPDYDLNGPQLNGPKLTPSESPKLDAQPPGSLAELMGADEPKMFSGNVPDESARELQPIPEAAFASPSAPPQERPLNPGSRPQIKQHNWPPSGVRVTPPCKMERRITIIVVRRPNLGATGTAAYACGQQSRTKYSRYGGIPKRDATCNISGRSFCMSSVNRSSGPSSSCNRGAEVPFAPLARK